MVPYFRGVSLNRNNEELMWSEVLFLKWHWTVENQIVSKHRCERETAESNEIDFWGISSILAVLELYLFPKKETSQGENRYHIRGIIIPKQKGKNKECATHRELIGFNRTKEINENIQEKKFNDCDWRCVWKIMRSCLQSSLCTRTKNTPYNPSSTHNSHLNTISINIKAIFTLRISARKIGFDARRLLWQKNEKKVEEKSVFYAGIRNFHNFPACLFCDSAIR